MNCLARILVATIAAACFANDANAQVVNLLVGNQSGFAGIDRYDSTNGSYQGVFASGSGSEFSFFKYGGPNANLFVQQANNVLQFNGLTGNFINVFSTIALGGQFTFGPDNNMYRLEGTGTKAIGRYNGSTGVRLGTFVDAGISGLNSTAGGMRFGPNGNLYVDNGNTMLGFNGTTGAPLGAFFSPGSGGLAAVLDAVFASNGDLIVSGLNGSTNDATYRFDGTTGAYLGVFASGNGIDVPKGIAEGPDGRIYLVSSFSNQIKRFDLSNGTFLGNFISSTTHQFPSHIVFTPSPIPEPTSLFLCSIAGSAASICAIRRRRTIAQQSAKSKVPDFWSTKC